MFINREYLLFAVPKIVYEPTIKFLTYVLDRYQVNVQTIQAMYKNEPARRALRNVGIPVVVTVVKSRAKKEDVSKVVEELDAKLVIAEDYEDMLRKALEFFGTMNGLNEWLLDLMLYTAYAKESSEYPKAPYRKLTMYNRPTFPVPFRLPAFPPSSTISSIIKARIENDMAFVRIDEDSLMKLSVTALLGSAIKGMPFVIEGTEKVVAGIAGKCSCEPIESEALTIKNYNDSYGLNIVEIIADDVSKVKEVLETYKWEVKKDTELERAYNRSILAQKRRA